MKRSYWIHPERGYHEGHAYPDGRDIEVPRRPSAVHVWNGTRWIGNWTRLILQAKEQIDAAAEQARLRYITPGAGQALTYLQKEADARAYIQLGYLETQIDQYPWVQAEAEALGISAREAADSIFTTAEQWRSVALSIEQHRRTGTKAVEEAVRTGGTDQEILAGIAAARDASIALLAGL